MRLATTGLSVLLLVAAAAAQSKTRPDKLSEKSFAAALAAILPDPAENQWRKIAWWPDLSDAIVEARKHKKPILLWAMNGHPCGMT